VLLPPLLATPALPAVPAPPLVPPLFEKGLGLLLFPPHAETVAKTATKPNTKPRIASFGVTAEPAAAPPSPPGQ
jgi:hypothetical protein